MTENQIAEDIVDAAFQINSRIGPGCVESAYELILSHELTKHGHVVRRQVPVAVEYDKLVVADAFKIDMVVDELVVVEQKAVEELHPVHFKQLLTYLRFTGMRLGLLVNFNVARMKRGIHRVVNGLPDS